MAPMAGGVADREQDRPIGASCLRDRLLAPRPPMHGVVGVLQQVGAGLATQAIAAFAHGGGSPRLPSLLISRTRAWRSSFSASKAAGSPPSGWAYRRRAGATAPSSMVMNQSAAKPTTGQVIGEIARQARPPITVSASPLAGAGLPWRLLWNQQSALCGSMTTKVGRAGRTAHR